MDTSTATSIVWQFIPNVSAKGGLICKIFKYIIMCGRIQPFCLCSYQMNNGTRPNELLPHIQGCQGCTALVWRYGCHPSRGGMEADQRRDGMDDGLQHFTSAIPTKGREYNYFSRAARRSCQQITVQQIYKGMQLLPGSQTYKVTRLRRTDEGRQCNLFDKGMKQLS